MDDLGPTIYLYTSRCIMCTRCVRFTEEITGTEELKVIHRGAHAEIEVAPGRPLNNRMMGNVVDYDEMQTRQRREGVFGAIYWWMVKLGMALAGLLTGILLNASGFAVDAPSQPERTLFLLRVFDVGVPLVTSAIAIFVMLTYPITERRAYEIRAELVRRRGETG